MTAKRARAEALAWIPQLLGAPGPVEAARLYATTQHRHNPAPAQRCGYRSEAWIIRVVGMTGNPAQGLPPSVASDWFLARPDGDKRDKMVRRIDDDGSRQATGQAINLLI